MQVVGEEKKEAAVEKPVETTDSETHEAPNAFDKPGENTPFTEADSGTEATSKLPGTPASLENKVKVNNEEYTKADLSITPEDKAAFIDAMVTGERYRRVYDIFGGRVHVTIRSRTTTETNAMYAYIRHELAAKGENNSGFIEGEMSYVPLVAQIEEINGTRFPEMKLPLTYEMVDGKEVEPGWMKDFQAWKNRPEGLVSALVNRVQLFEYKYWYMVKEASNKNFWNSDTSIAG